MKDFYKGIGIATCISTVLYLFITIGQYVQRGSVTVERSPLLYCQYGAGYGVAVFEFETIATDLILTDGNDVFSTLVCNEWKEYMNE